MRFRLGGLIHGGAYVQNFTVVKLANIVYNNKMQKQAKFVELYKMVKQDEMIQLDN